jgi:hypothetical protein
MRHQKLKQTILAFGQSNATAAAKDFRLAEIHMDSTQANVRGPSVARPGPVHHVAAACEEIDDGLYEPRFILDNEKLITHRSIDEIRSKMPAMLLLFLTGRRSLQKVAGSLNFWTRQRSTSG